jgi:hypothetical protein
MPRRFFTVLAAGGCLAVLALKASAGPLIIEPDWIQKPDGHLMSGAYPPLANDLFIEGKATLRCLTTAEGVLRDCTALTEWPKGLGFGAAALSTTPAFRLSPKMIDGRGVAGGEVRIPISFKLPPDSASFSPGPPTSVRALEIARKLVAAEGEKARLAALYAEDSPTLANWRGPRQDAATLEAYRAARRAAFETEAPAWLEASARTYAGMFTADQLAAKLAFAQSPAGQALARRQADLDALSAPIGWIAFRVGLAQGRKLYCEAHDCLRDPAASDKAAPEAAPSITAPDWIEKPGRWQLTDTTPFLARTLSLAGEVKLRCKVSVIGSTSDCKAIYETPKGLGFAEAAINVAGYYRAQPLPPDLAPQSPTAEIVVRFPEFPASPPAFPKQPELTGTPTDGQLALAGELMTAAGLDATVADMIARNMRSFDEVPSPSVDGRTRADVRDALAKGLEASSVVWKLARARLYANLFSETELKSMLQWERSAEAAEFRKQQPRLAEADIARGKTFYAVVGKRAGRNFCATRNCLTAVQPDKSEAGYKPPKP